MKFVIVSLTFLCMACTQEEVVQTVGKSLLLSGCKQSRDCTAHDGELVGRP